MRLAALMTVGLLCLAPRAARAAQDGPAVMELQQKAQRAYLEGRYADAVAANLEIAQEHAESQARRYAVQMLGTLYEDNVVDIPKAIKWDREFLEKYADQRQAPFYKAKLASLEQLERQKDAFSIYQKIRFGNQDDQAMVRQFEALLKAHPDFLLKDKVQRELGYAYARLDKRKQSYLAFQALADNGKKPLSSTDRVAYQTATRYWNESSAWKWAAWAVVALLWSAAVLMNPWKRISRSSIRVFLILAVIWVALSAVRMPTFYSLETLGYPTIIPDRVVFAAAGLNLIVLLWQLLFTSGRFWQSRPKTLRWLAPFLTVLMTTAVMYLLIIRQPNGPQVMDAFSLQYERWADEWQRHQRSSEPDQRAPGGQEERVANLPSHASEVREEVER
jgi:tetratricopeptide (TPR) repeat protein